MGNPKVIVTVAPTGGMANKQQNQHLPKDAVFNSCGLVNGRTGGNGWPRSRRRPHKSRRTAS